MGCSAFRKGIISFSFTFFLAKAQPYIDLASYGAQHFQSRYKDVANSHNETNNYFLNLTAPIKVDSSNIIIVRFYGENLQSTITNDSLKQTRNLYSALLPVGWQHQFSNRKWKALGLLMPKLSSDLVNKINGYDLQLGGYGLITYERNKWLTFKLGLFYNREFFGNFFVPLLGVDWQPVPRFRMYGILPTFYRFEYGFVERKIYGGLAFKSYTRSYRLDSYYNHDYVKNVEIQAKLFVDFYINKLVLFAEAGRTLSYGPQAYNSDTKTPASLPLYSPLKDNFFFQLGVAYRIRFSY